jgi:hypothetical protein
VHDKATFCNDTIFRLTRWFIWTDPSGRHIQTRARKNQCFHGATTVSPTDVSVLKNGKIALLQNWYEEPKRPQENPENYYSLNIHLLLEQEGKRPVPIIIDPDTGNGQDNGPP